MLHTRDAYNELLQHNCLLILWTCRDMTKASEAEPVLKFLRDNGIDNIYIISDRKADYLELARVSDAYPIKYKTFSGVKPYFDFLVDDYSVGIPLRDGVLDWAEITTRIKVEINRYCHQ